MTKKCASVGDSALAAFLTGNAPATAGVLNKAKKAFAPKAAPKIEPNARDTPTAKTLAVVSIIASEKPAPA
jgi:hypothetical protein